MVQAMTKVLGVSVNFDVDRSGVLKRGCDSMVGIKDSILSLVGMLKYWGSGEQYWDGVYKYTG